MTKNRVDAVDRALTILDVFDAEKRNLHLKDIAKATGYYKSTILRLMGSLEAFGYVRRSEAGLYSLGPKLWQLGNRYHQSMDIESHVRAALKKLVEDTGENASFYIRDKTVRVCLYRENSRHAIQHAIIEGEHLPLDQGAAGKVLLAFDKTVTPSAALRKVRSQGYYYSAGERDRYAAAIAAPVFDHANQCLGALAVSGLRERFTDKALPRFRLALIRQASQLSTILGSDTHA